MQCDLYAYESYDCFIIHVRSQHPVNPEILPDMPLEAIKAGDVHAVMEWQEESREAHDRIVWRDIGLPYDGQTLSYGSEEDMMEGMWMLKQMGYYVPDGVFD